ncbi:MAG: asparagine synthase (glutamine-hydrolyzing), partial [bacterium]|nr:asparagine synthase (glutamine-hydrolyzing) [bacterium]
MCGILGYVALARPARGPALRAALDEMNYRGPDARGAYLAPGRDRSVTRPHATDNASGRIADPLLFDPGLPENEVLASWPDGPAVLFGHLRLAIIDLHERSNQPMLRGALALVFNGEIYNYIELRSELAQLGHKFVTNGDSEVILAAYEQWGQDCVHRLRGMFAIALHDRAVGTLWLARDRFAIKPLYVALRPGVLAFASEAHALPVLLRETAQANSRALFHLLAHSCYAFDGESFYRGVEQLLPGEDMLVDLATLTGQRRRYYDLRQIVPALEMLPATNDTVESFRATFDNALRIHLRSDVPLGVGLSGGLDSSAILGTIASHCMQGGAEAGATPNTELLQRVVAFSSVFTDADADEGRFIRAMLDYTGIPGRSVTPEFEPLLEKLPALCRAHDSPLSGLSLLVQHSVMQLAKSCGVTVVINGQGGDELLCGYLRSIMYFALGQLKRHPLQGI